MGLKNTGNKRQVTGRSTPPCHLLLAGYLNVWKADKVSAKKKPVMVYIHGGGFVNGGTADPMFDCHNLVKENPDIVVVTVAYRLGIFGFFHISHLPDGGDYPDTQNLGTMDQMMALKWVHENIKGFGGDPDNVTIFGESAGAASCTLLPLVKGSHQYIKRLIAESGSPTITISTEEALECTNEIMNTLGCKTVAELQKVDVEKFMQEAGAALNLRVWAERDGRILPLDPFAAYEDDTVKNLDFLHGCDKDELGYFVYGFGLEGFKAFADDRKAKKLAQLTEEEKALVESYCRDAKDVTPEYSCDARLFDQICFIAPMFRLAENQTKAGGRAYVYYFTPESSKPLIRSGHGI